MEDRYENRQHRRSPRYGCEHRIRFPRRPSDELDCGRVQVELTHDESDAILRITDTGIGIPQEDLPRVFERFVRVDKARSRARGGRGLGLAIARWIVELHGGTISLLSQLGEGSEFTVRLPGSKPGAKHQSPLRGANLSFFLSPPSHKHDN